MSQSEQQPLYVHDMIGTVAAAVDTTLFGTGNPAFPHVYYAHGHPREIVNDLQAKLRDDNLKDKRLPLIMLFHDYEVLRNSNVYYGTANLNIAIAALTQQNWSTAERYVNTFKPILEPIYFELLRQLGKSTYFVNALAMVEHTKIDRVFWGRTGIYGNEGNTFNDYLDCIELKGTKLTVKQQHCKPFKS